MPDEHKSDQELIAELFENEGVTGDDPPWYARTIRELIDRNEELNKCEAGDAEPLSDDVWRAVYDLRHLMDRPKQKWYPGRATKKKGICVHHTAVSGGFGAHRSELRRYHAMTHEQLEVQARSIKDFKGEPIHSSEFDDVGRALALASRYRGYPSGKYNSGLPYHAISGANSVLYLNLPFDLVTWHGNGANTEYLGYAWDANSNKDDLPAEDLMADLHHLVTLARSEGHPIESLTGHCAWTNKPADPGKEFIECVMVPIAKELDLTIDWTFKSKPRAKSLDEIVRGS